jgi:hypothetical protein
MPAAHREIKAIMASAPDIEQERPAAPEDLSEPEKELWDRIVKSLPPEFFPVHTHGLLREFCRHTLLAKKFGEQLWAITDEPPENVKVLRIIRDIHSLYLQHSKMAVILSMKLRLISGLSPTDARLLRKRMQAGGRQPWDLPSPEDLDRELAAEH